MNTHTAATHCLNTQNVTKLTAEMVIYFTYLYVVHHTLYILHVEKYLQHITEIDIFIQE